MVVVVSSVKRYINDWKRIIAVALWAVACFGFLTANASAQTADGKLSDAWLATLQQDTLQPGDPPLAWSHAFALQLSTATALESQRTRLIHELEGAMLGASVVGNTALAAGLEAWRNTLQEVPALPGRTPGRHDLPWLGANLRHDPPLSRVQHWGYCEVPSWIEIWHYHGISRLAWRSGMSLDDALSTLAANAYRHAEQAVVIAPNGEQTSRGISAWNHQATPLSPGGRVVLMLPSDGALSAAVQREVSIINQRLPAYLATRLPGDACRLHSAGEEGRAVR